MSGYWGSIYKRKTNSPMDVMNMRNRHKIPLTKHHSIAVLIAVMLFIIVGCLPGGTFVDYRQEFHVDTSPEIMVDNPILTHTPMNPHNMHELIELSLFPGRYLSPIADIAFKRNEKLIFAIHATDGWIEAWDVAAASPVFDTRTGSVGIIGAAFSPELNYVAEVAGTNRSLENSELLADFDGVRVFHVATGDLVWESVKAQWSSPKNMVAWSPDGMKLAEQDTWSISLVSAGDWSEGTAIGLSIVDGIEGPSAELTSIAFDATGDWLLIGTEKGDVVVESIQTTENNATSDVLSLPNDDFILKTVSSPSNHYIGAIGTQRLIVWDTLSLNQWFSGGAIRLYSEHNYTPAADLAFSPDGKLLAVGTKSMWQIWSVEEGELLKEHPQGSYALAFSPDGRLFAWGDLEGNVHIWGIPDSQ